MGLRWMFSSRWLLENSVFPAVRVEVGSPTGKSRGFFLRVLIKSPQSRLIARDETESISRSKRLREGNVRRAEC